METPPPSVGGPFSFLNHMLSWLCLSSAGREMLRGEPPGITENTGSASEVDMACVGSCPSGEIEGPTLQALMVT